MKRDTTQSIMVDGNMATWVWKLESGEQRVIVDFDALRSEHPSLAEPSSNAGFVMTLRNSYALERDTKTGHSASVEDKYTAFMNRLESLRDGVWSGTRGVRGTSDDYLVFRAFQRQYSDKHFPTMERFEEFVRECMTKQKGVSRKAMIAALADRPTIKTALEAIRAEMTSAVDNSAIDSMLDQFESDSE